MSSAGGRAENARPVAAFVDSPLGRLGIELEGAMLIGIDLAPREPRALVPQSRAAQRVVTALQRYFESPRSVGFELPLRLRGTDFQRRVWGTLRHIPIGEIVTYGDLARRLSSSARAVGAACRANPIPIVVPCHRVVGATDLGGFAGARSGTMVQIKRWLLEHEGYLGRSAVDADND